MWSNTKLVLVQAKLQYVTLHGKTGKKVMTRARYFNTVDKRKFL